MTTFRSFILAVSVFIACPAYAACPGSFAAEVAEVVTGAAEQLIQLRRLGQQSCELLLGSAQRAMLDVEYSARVDFLGALSKNLPTELSEQTAQELAKLLEQVTNRLAGSAVSSSKASCEAYDLSERTLGRLIRCS